MLDMFVNFERSAVYLSPMVLLCIGIIAAAIGLVSWLAGMALRKLFLFITGAVAGAIVGFYFVGRKTISAIGLAALFAIVAAFLDKLFVTLLAAALAVIIAISIMAWHYDLQIAVQSVTEKAYTPLNESQTLQFLQASIVSLVRYIGDVYHNAPNHCWLIVPILIVVFITLGIFFWNLVCAWLWATVGTIFIFAGMISLLLYKGSSPISAILNSGNYYAAIFTAMVTLGTVVQLLLFHHIKTKEPKAIKKSDNQKEQSQQQGWRGL
jgi:hypothetical protein